MRAGIFISGLGLGFIVASWPSSTVDGRSVLAGSSILEKLEASVSLARPLGSAETPRLQISDRQVAPSTGREAIGMEIGEIRLRPRARTSPSKALMDQPGFRGRRDAPALANSRITRLTSAPIRTGTDSMQRSDLQRSDVQPPTSTSARTSRAAPEVVGRLRSNEASLLPGDLEMAGGDPGGGDARARLYADGAQAKDRAEATTEIVDPWAPTPEAGWVRDLRLLSDPWSGHPSRER